MEGVVVLGALPDVLSGPGMADGRWEEPRLVGLLEDILGHSLVLVPLVAEGSYLALHELADLCGAGSVGFVPDVPSPP